MNRIWLGLLAAWLLICHGDLRAAPLEPCTAAYRKQITNGDVPAASVYAIISQEQQTGCILGPTDTTGIEQLAKVLHDAKANEKAAARQALFQLVIGEFDGFSSTPCDGTSLDCSAGRHLTKIRELEQALNGGVINPRDPLIASASWSIVPATHRVPISNIDLLNLLSTECASAVQSSRCLIAVDFAAKVMRTSEVMHELANAYSQPLIEVDARFLTESDKEWNSYMNDISVQYPWELWLNGMIFQKDTPAALRSEFPKPPNSRWVFLHPSPAFERVEAPTGGHSTQAAVFVELTGYERWQWDSGAANNRWGASIITSFVDAKGSNAVGYGLLLKTPFKNASVGVVWRNGDRGHQVNLAINVDLAKLIQKYKDVDVYNFIGSKK